MDTNMITDVISTLGFPIAMCIMMLYFLHQEQKNHKEEMNDLKDVISKNNEILASLKQLIDDKLS